MSASPTPGAPAQPPSKQPTHSDAAQYSYRTKAVVLDGDADGDVDADGVVVADVTAPHESSAQARQSPAASTAQQFRYASLPTLGLVFAMHRPSPRHRPNTIDDS